MYNTKGTAINVAMTQLDISTVSGTWDLAARVTSSKNLPRVTVYEPDLRLGYGFRQVGSSDDAGG